MCKRREHASNFSHRPMYGGPATAKFVRSIRVSRTPLVLLWWIFLSGGTSMSEVSDLRSTMCLDDRFNTSPNFLPVSKKVGKTDEDLCEPMKFLVPARKPRVPPNLQRLQLRFEDPTSVAGRYRNKWRRAQTFSRCVRSGVARAWRHLVRPRNPAV